MTLHLSNELEKTYSALVSSTEDIMQLSAVVYSMIQEKEKLEDILEVYNKVNAMINGDREVLHPILDFNSHYLDSLDEYHAEEVRKDFEDVDGDLITLQTLLEEIVNEN